MPRFRGTDRFWHRCFIFGVYRLRAGTRERTRACVNKISALGEIRSQRYNCENQMTMIIGNLVTAYMPDTVFKTEESLRYSGASNNVAYILAEPTTVSILPANFPVISKYGSIKARGSLVCLLTKSFKKFMAFDFEVASRANMPKMRRLSARVARVMKETREEEAETDHRARRVYLHSPRPYKVTRVHYVTFLRAMLSHLSRYTILSFPLSLSLSLSLSLFLASGSRILRALYLPVRSWRSYFLPHYRGLNKSALARDT